MEPTQPGRGVSRAVANTGPGESIFVGPVESIGDALLLETAAGDSVSVSCLGFELINWAPSRAGQVAIRISGASDAQAIQAVSLRS